MKKVKKEFAWKVQLDDDRPRKPRKVRPMPRPASPTSSNVSCWIAQGSIAASRSFSDYSQRFFLALWYTILILWVPVSDWSD